MLFETPASKDDEIRGPFMSLWPIQSHAISGPVSPRPIELIVPNAQAPTGIIKLNKELTASIG